MKAVQREWIWWGVIFKVFLLVGSVLCLLYLVWMLRQPEILDLYRQIMP